MSTQEPDDVRLGWDFRDELNTMCIACRLGTVGLVAVLQDGGAQMPWFPLMKLQRRRLHPTQFTEVIAQVTYRATLFNRIPKYLIADGDPITVNQMPLGGLSGKPLYEDWNQHHYAQILCEITGVTMDHLFHPPDQVMTLLRNSDGTSKSMSLKRFPMHFEG
ncbi:MAG: hypothetical protein IID38_08155 [Planctomycetes bacterium]|nr:hypothetical protein [Planctomycetota bacterium]